MVRDRIFFIHIMKTAGGTFRRHLEAAVPVGSLYPEGHVHGDPLASYWDIQRLLSLDEDRRAAVHVFCGHFPYVVTEMLDLDLKVMTVLREPVERTLSYLKMASRQKGRLQGWTFEEIYEDGFAFPFMIQNHQAKIFSMRSSDRLETHMDVIDVDASRLEEAKENLAGLDLFGLTEEFDRFLDAARDQFGINIGDVVDAHVAGGELAVPQSFLDRIAEDNAADLELYGFARDLLAERRAAAES